MYASFAVPQLTWYVPIEQWGKRTYFHFQILNTWQWLMASGTQLATLLPTELAIGVCRTPLWRKLAASVTTSLYMKSHGLGELPNAYYKVPNNVYQQPDRWPRVVTFIHYMCTLLPPACCSWQHKAAKGLTPLPFGIFWKMEPNPRRAVQRQKKGSSIAIFHNFKAQASRSLPMLVIGFFKKTVHVSHWAIKPQQRLTVGMLPTRRSLNNCSFRNGIAIPSPELIWNIWMLPQKWACAGTFIWKNFQIDPD